MIYIISCQLSCSPHRFYFGIMRKLILTIFSEHESLAVWLQTSLFSGQLFVMNLKEMVSEGRFELDLKNRDTNLLQKPSSYARPSSFASSLHSVVPYTSVLTFRDARMTVFV